MSLHTTSHTFVSPAYRGVVKDAIAFFARTPVYQLPPTGQFNGAGVYALYYIGDNELYASIAKANRAEFVQPIYVGKAVTPGWRTGRTTGADTADLARRLREHAGSITQAAGLRVEDFRCRFMILGSEEGDLVGPVEAQLIRTYQPLWNTLIDGFGNHDPGKGRYNQARSEWDVLHPGRIWASRLTGVSPRKEQIIAKLRLHRTSSAPLPFN